MGQKGMDFKHKEVINIRNGQRLQSLLILWLKIMILLLHGTKLDALEKL